jgi:NADH-quinone oxidoreductase subunit E
MSVRRLADRQPADFAFSAENRAWAERQLEKYPPGKQASAIVPLLWRAQEQHDGWLPEPAIRYVADFLGVPHIRALEVATFYTMFNLSPVGRSHIQLCGTTPCWLRGADRLKDICIEKIGPQNRVTEDGALSWIEVECLGACVNAPMAQIGPDFYEDLTPENFSWMLDNLRAGRSVEPGPQSGRQTSAPAGGPTTLREKPAEPKKARSGRKPKEAVTDDEAKTPGEAADVREEPKPESPPLAEDAGDTKE